MLACMASLTHLCGELFNTPLLLYRDKADVLENLLRAKLAGTDITAIPKKARTDKAQTESSRDYRLEDGIAIVPLIGTLIRRGTQMDSLSGLTSYNKIRGQVQAAIEDPEVQGLMLEFDSGDRLFLMRPDFQQH